MSGELNPLTGTGGRLPQLYNRQENDELLFSGILTASFVKLYTAPSGSYPTGARHSSRVTDVIVCNGDVATRAFYVCVVPSGGSALISNARFWGTPIEASTSYFMNTAKFTIPNAYEIWAKADVTAVVCLTLEGIEIR